MSLSLIYLFDFFKKASATHALCRILMAFRNIANEQRVICPYRHGDGFDSCLVTLPTNMRRKYSARRYCGAEGSCLSPSRQLRRRGRHPYKHTDVTDTVTTKTIKIVQFSAGWRDNRQNSGLWRNTATQSKRMTIGNGMGNNGKGMEGYR